MVVLSSPTSTTFSWRGYACSFALALLYISCPCGFGVAVIHLRWFKCVSLAVEAPVPVSGVSVITESGLGCGIRNPGHQPYDWHISPYVDGSNWWFFEHIPGVFIRVSLLPSRHGTKRFAKSRKCHTLPAITDLNTRIALHYVTNGSQTLGESFQVDLGGIHRVRARVGGRLSRSVLGDG